MSGYGYCFSTLRAIGVGRIYVIQEVAAMNTAERRIPRPTRHLAYLLLRMRRGSLRPTAHPTHATQYSKLLQYRKHRRELLAMPPFRHQLGPGYALQLQVVGL
jgi:hypothetical protein